MALSQRAAAKLRRDRQTLNTAGRILTEMQLPGQGYCLAGVEQITQQLGEVVVRDAQQ